jgi:hypothetical protein
LSVEKVPAKIRDYAFDKPRVGTARCAVDPLQWRKREFAYLKVNGVSGEEVLSEAMTLLAKVKLI